MLELKNANNPNQCPFSDLSGRGWSHADCHDSAVKLCNYSFEPPLVLNAKFLLEPISALALTNKSQLPDV